MLSRCTQVSLFLSTNYKFGFFQEMDNTAELNITTVTNRLEAASLTEAQVSSSQEHNRPRVCSTRRFLFGDISFGSEKEQTSVGWVPLDDVIYEQNPAAKEDMTFKITVEMYQHRLNEMITIVQPSSQGWKTDEFIEKFEEYLRATPGKYQVIKEILQKRRDSGERFLSVIELNNSLTKEYQQIENSVENS